jgi:hypothetical protein
MNYKDNLIELISLSLTQDYWPESLVKRISVMPPTETVQAIEVENINGEKFRIEVTKL